jgi:type I restriction enzyme, S subunit
MQDLKDAPNVLLLIDPVIKLHQFCMFHGPEPVEPLRPWFSGSAYAQFYFMSRSKQSTNLASISSTNIIELPVVVPPDDEQKALLDWLDAQSTGFDLLTEGAGNAVRLLRERRTALISAAVTGQIDVRQPSPTQSTPTAHLQPHDEPHGL